MLAKDVNDNACCLNERGVWTFFASKLAPTGPRYIRQNQVGWQAAIASKLAPTEEQSKSRASRTTASLLTTHQAER